MSKQDKIYFNLGLKFAKSNDLNKAIFNFTKAIELNPNYTTAYKERGDVKIDLDDYQGAIDDFSKVIELDLEDSVAYRNRGLAKALLENYQEAIDDYTKAIKIDPDYFLAYCNRGFAKMKSKNYQGSINDYTKAIEIDPEDALAYRNCGSAKSYLGDYEGAIDNFSKAIELDPEDAVAFMKRGNSKMELYDYQGAIDDFSRAIELDLEDTCLYRNSGFAKTYLEDYQGAIDDFSKVIELDPKDAEAYRNRGIAKREVGDFNSSLEDLGIAKEQGDVYAIQLLELSSYTKDELVKEREKKISFLYELNVPTTLKSIGLNTLPCSDYAFYITLSLYISFIEKPIKNFSPATKDSSLSSMATLRVLLNLLHDTDPETWEDEQVSDETNSKQHLIMCRFYAETYLEQKLAKDWVENERLVEYDEKDPDPFIADIWTLPPPSFIPEDQEDEFPPLHEWETHYENKQALLNDVDWELIARTVAAAWLDSIDPYEVEKCRMCFQL